MNKQYWLSPKILEWRHTVLSSTLYSDNSWKRAYDYWYHAETTVNNGKNEFHRIDIITSLNRSIQNRIKLLGKRYNFKKIPIGDKPNQLIEQLEFFGVLRKSMLNTLIDIRNQVEHKYTSPPSLDKCQIFVEFTWYFLRSTDHLVREVIQDLNISPIDDDSEHNFGLELNIGPENNWKINFGGYIRHELISPKKIKNFILVKLHKLKDIDELLSVFEEDDDNYRIEMYESFKKAGGAKYISGQIIGPGHHLKKLFTNYFTAV